MLALGPSQNLKDCEEPQVNINDEWEVWEVSTHIPQLASLPLLETLPDAANNAEALLNGEGSLCSHDLIGFPAQLPALRMTDNNPWHIHVRQHPCRDLREIEKQIRVGQVSEMTGTTL